MKNNKQIKIDFFSDIQSNPEVVGKIKELFKKKAKMKNKIDEIENLFYKNYLLANINNYEDQDLISGSGAMNLGCFGLFRPARRLTEEEFVEKSLKNKKFAKKWSGDEE